MIRYLKAYELKNFLVKNVVKCLGFLKLEKIDSIFFKGMRLITKTFRLFYARETHYVKTNRVCLRFYNVGYANFELF